MILRFVGTDQNGVALQELRAAHVAEVLQGLVGLTSDFEKAGVFHEDGPSGSEVLVRPPREGSFIIEVVRMATDNWDAAKIAAATAEAAVVGVPSLSSILWWATKSTRAQVKDVTYLDNGNVKINWQDDTVDEVPAAAWNELKTRKTRRKKQLRQIMAPLSDTRVTEVDVANPSAPDHYEATDKNAQTTASPQSFVLRRSDYDAVRPEDEVQQSSEIFSAEAQMAAINFDDPTKWRVKTRNRTRNVAVEDSAFLGRVAHGLAIRRTDIFWLRIREDKTVTNGRTQTHWTVEKVETYRRAAGDNESQEANPTSD
ncbi:hypothetical protein H7I40_22770 [Mycolicibacterium madagascariense]|nr:hypothetical protein [Mycolicibacterium madagascariense]